MMENMVTAARQIRNLLNCAVKFWAKFDEDQDWSNKKMPQRIDRATRRTSTKRCRFFTWLVWCDCLPPLL